jgi:hypothetical protein
MTKEETDVISAAEAYVAAAKDCEASKDEPSQKILGRLAAFFESAKNVRKAVEALQKARGTVKTKLNIRDVN